MKSPAFTILGPLEASVDGVPVVIGGRRQQVLLAVLIDRRNTVVSRDRLIDEVWDGEPPDSVHAALQNAVSQLRRALEPARDAGAASRVLETRGTGYVLHVPPDALDLDRVRALQTAARAAAAEGDGPTAAGLLRSALAEWRGEPLADVEADAARAIAARLAPLRIDLEEELLELEVAAGHHRAALPRLQELVAAEPLRGRLRVALMLALYRSGRQTEALATYRDGARAFADVGLAPDVELQRLERAMLQHDPALDAPRAPSPSVAARRGRRVVIGAAGLAVIAAVAGGALLVGRDDAPPAAAARPAGDRLVGLDARTGQVVAQFGVGGTPTGVATTDGAAWVLNADDATISRIDLETGAAQTFGSGAIPVDLAAGGGALWVANGRRTDAQFVGPVGSEVSRVDPATRAVLLTTSLPRRRGLTSNVSRGRLAVTPTAVWAVSSDDRVIRLDPASGRILTELGDVTAQAIAAGGAGVWVLENTGVARLDPTGTSVAERVPLALVEPEAMVVDAAGVWIADGATGLLWHVRPGAEPASIALDPGIGALALTPDGVWVANARDGDLTRVDPATNTVAGRTRMDGVPRGLATAAGKVWVTVAATPRTAGALPAATCGELITDGTGPPDVVLVTDAPMRAGARLPTLQVRDAALQTIRAAGFRAGRFRVGFAACDDSTAQTAIFDADKCAANAHLYVASPSVVGEIGPYNSGCALAQIPIANGAEGGPLAMVSPTASLPGLTQAARGTAAAAELYPAGVRSFARIYPADDLQGVALAQYARERGARRVAVVLGAYGADQAQAFARTAEDLGLTVAGVVRATPQHPEPPARAVARLHPDTVLVASLIDDGGGELVRALRRRLGAGVTLLGIDGLLPVSALWAHAGSAARGVVVAAPGTAVERLPAAGQRFADAFASTHGGQPAEPAAVAAAAATEVLLDAIRRSDGTRAGVAKALLATHVDGVLGPIRFDANGDVVPATVTLATVERGGGADVAESIDGARVERVVQLGGS